MDISPVKRTAIVAGALVGLWAGPVLSQIASGSKIISPSSKKPVAAAKAEVTKNVMSDNGAIVVLDNKGVPTAFVYGSDPVRSDDTKIQQVAKNEMRDPK